MIGWGEDSIQRKIVCWNLLLSMPRQCGTIVGLHHLLVLAYLQGHTVTLPQTVEMAFANAHHP